jgi:hypothetical protein
VPSRSSVVHELHLAGSILTVDHTFCHLFRQFLHGQRTDAAFLSLRFARFSGNLNPWTARWSGIANGGFVPPEL